MVSMARKRWKGGVGWVDGGEGEAGEWGSGGGRGAAWSKNSYGGVLWRDGMRVGWLASRELVAWGKGNDQKRARLKPYWTGRRVVH